MGEAILIDIKPSFNLKISARSGNGQKNTKNNVRRYEIPASYKIPSKSDTGKNFIKHRTVWLISASTVLETAM